MRAISLSFPEPNKTMEKMTVATIVSIIVIIAIIAMIVYKLFVGEGYQTTYATLASYGNYRPYGNGYNYADTDDSYVLKRCAAGPYTYASNPDMSAMCSTIPADALEALDCTRVQRMRYEAPAFSTCSGTNDQSYADFRVTGAPALKYPYVLSTF